MSTDRQNRLANGMAEIDLAARRQYEAASAVSGAMNLREAAQNNPTRSLEVNYGGGYRVFGPPDVIFGTNWRERLDSLVAHFEAKHERTIEAHEAAIRSAAAAVPA